MITNEPEYKDACKQLEKLGDTPNFNKEEFEKLANEIEAYENTLSNRRCFYRGNRKT